MKAQYIVFRIKRSNKSMDEEHKVSDIITEIKRTMNTLETKYWSETFGVTNVKLEGGDHYYYKDITYSQFWNLLYSLLLMLDDYVDSFDMDFMTEEGREFKYINKFEEIFKKFDIELVSYQYLI